MPLETLNEQQKAFISQYLSKSMFKGKSNRKTVGDYEAYLAQEGMFKELATALPKDDPRTVEIMRDLRPAMDHKNTGQFGPATDEMAELVRRGLELKAELEQSKRSLQQRLDRAPLPDWLPQDVSQQATPLRARIVKALEPELVSGAVLDQAKLDLTSLEQMLAQATIVRTRDELKRQLTPVTLKPWVPTDHVEPLTSLRQKVETALALEPPTQGSVAGAKKDLDSLVDGIGQAETAVRNLKQEKMRAIAGMTNPTFTMSQQAKGELDTLRNTATQAMVADLPLPAQFTAATDAINQFDVKLREAQDKNRLAVEKKQSLLQALPGLATPGWAGPQAVQAMKGFRETATTALTDNPPAADKLLAAEQAIEALRGALRDETQRVTNQKAALQRRLTAAANPPGADTDDQRAMGTERQKATNALSAEFPTPDQMKVAETAIRALEGLVKQVNQVAGVAGKYGPTSDVAAQTKGAFKQFRGVLGNVEVNDKLVEDAKQDAAQKAQALQEKLKAWQDANALPDGTTDRQRRAKQAEIDRTAQEWLDLKPESDKADAFLKAALGQKNLTDALAGGPLSGNSDQTFKPETAATLIKGFTENPTLAKSATDAAKTAKFPDAIAEGWPKVRDAAATGFKSDTSGGFADQSSAEKYGANLLKAGGNAGAGYFDALPEFLASGGQFASHPFGPIPGTWPEVTDARTKEIAGKLMKDDGTIDLDSPEAKGIIGQAMYGWDAMEYPTPDLTKHLMKTLKQLKDPQASEVMKGVTAPPSNPSAQGLVRSSLGKTGTISKEDTRQAIMKSMLTPLSQGAVGSCFATAPVRKMRETQPIEALKSFTQIATKGTYQPKGSTTAVPVVTNLPPGDDPLMRSWEFSLATATEVSETSTQSTSFAGAMKPGISQFEPMAGGAPSEWNGKKSAVTAAIKTAFTFVYDPMLEVKDANDGSSTQGRYVLTLKAGNRPITTQDAFSEAIAEIAINSFGLGGSSDEANKIKTLTKTKPFLDAVCPDKYKPWELASGGYTNDATTTLFGGTQKVTSLMDKSPDSPAPTEGERTTSLMTGMMSKFRGKSDEMIVMRAVGIHGFNALPNDPSLEPLKGTNDTETQQKVQRNLVDKGQTLKNTDLPAERAQYLFDQELNKAIAAEKEKQPSNPDWVQLLEDGVKAKRPQGTMKPAALNQAIKEAMAPYQEAVATKETDDWKTSEENATPPRPVTPQKLLETLNATKKYKAEAGENEAKTSLMRDMAAPEFVIADTNWGSGQDHTFFVIAPDPTTGEPTLWQKTDPPGSMKPMGKDWLSAEWTSVE